MFRLILFFKTRRNCETPWVFKYIYGDYFLVLSIIIITSLLMATQRAIVCDIVIIYLILMYCPLAAYC